MTWTHEAAKTSLNKFDIVPAWFSCLLERYCSKCEKIAFPVGKFEAVDLDS